MVEVVKRGSMKKWWENLFSIAGEWYSEGMDRVALDKKARQLLALNNKRATNENLALAKTMITDAVKSTPVSKAKPFRPSSYPTGIGSKYSMTPVTKVQERQSNIVSKSDFAKLRDQYPINLQEFIDDPSAAAPSVQDQLRRSGIKPQSSASESRETKDIFKSVREDQERAVDNPFPYDPWYRKGQYPTGLNTFPDQDMRIKAAVDRALKSTEPTSSSFDRNKDIFHQIAYGIGKIIGQEPSVELIYPGDPNYNKKKGGKVKKKSKKKTTSKKYSMSRGGIASVRKPTRA